MKNKKSLLFKICLALFVIGIVVFITISILNLYVDDPISRVVFSIISTVRKLCIKNHHHFTNLRTFFGWLY